MKVAIVGTGISGVTLALRLQQLGITTTLYAHRPPEELRHSRIENLVARFAPTQDRERALGVAHWDDVEGYASAGIEVDVVGTGLRFSGHIDRVVRAVDFRLYLARLLEDYRDRGGALHVGPLAETADALVRATVGHDVVVVAAGRTSSVADELFPIRHDRSPFAEPQRKLCGGLFTGVAPTDPPMVSFNLVPGAGEVFQQQMLTHHGVVSAILVEAIPRGPLDVLPSPDPAALLSLIRDHAPALAARTDGSRFAALGPLDVLDGAVTPKVRHGSAVLADGRLAVAMGDAWITNDPITGQGANLGSHCAWVTADAIARATRLDATFGQELEGELWSYADPVTAWTNAFLQPPPPHLLDLLGAAATHQPVADAFARGFADPVGFATALSTPQATATFIDDALQLVEV